MNKIEILEQKRKNIRLKLIGILALCAIVDFIVTLGLWIFDLTAAIVGGLLAGLSLYFYLKYRYFSGFEESLKELIRDEVLKNLGLKALTKSSENTHTQYDEPCDGIYECISLGRHSPKSPSESVSFLLFREGVFMNEMIVKEIGSLSLRSQFATLNK